MEAESPLSETEDFHASAHLDDFKNEWNSDDNLENDKNFRKKVFSLFKLCFVAGKPGKIPKIIFSKEKFYEALEEYNANRQKILSK